MKYDDVLDTRSMMMMLQYMNYKPPFKDIKFMPQILLFYLSGPFTGVAYIAQK